jgi:hypothetical protein
MNSKTVILVSLFSLVAITLIAAGQLTSLTTEDVVTAASLYAVSRHADEESRAFTYWDDDDPPIVPADCARCHSPLGLMSYLGADGSQPGTVAEAPPSGRAIECRSCHNDRAHTLGSVSFNSGAEFAPVGSEGVCLICHQSRESTDSIEAALAGAAKDDPDTDLTFINPHYAVAASTKLGTLARSGYQYPGEEYAGYFEHAANAETCTDCHSAHSLRVEPDACKPCHVNVVGSLDFANIRQQAPSFDRDRLAGEGVKTEVDELMVLLYGMIQDYGENVAGRHIVYADQFPYFFVDTNEDGEANADEVSFGNQYDAWTPRLLKAAYNYQFSKQDPGGYVHNPRYILQLLHDSMLDLAERVTLPVDELVRP